MVSRSKNTKISRSENDCSSGMSSKTNICSMHLMNTESTPHRIMLLKWWGILGCHRFIFSSAARKLVMSSARLVSLSAYTLH